MPQHTYQQLLSRFTQKHDGLNRQLGWLSFTRLLLFIGVVAGIYFYLVGDNWKWLAATFLCALLFLYCIRLYDRLKYNADFTRALMEVNSNEIAFARGKPPSFGEGKEYTDPHHPYSYDLDLFGQGSLYQFLNRATTPFGRQQLANSLLRPTTQNIEQRQQAIRELREKTAFRQNIQAFGSMHPPKEKDLEKLKQWIEGTVAFRHRWVYYSLFIFPVSALAVLGFYFTSGNERALSLFYLMFGINLAVTFAFARKMSKQLAISTTVTEILRQFAGQLDEIGKQQFQSPYLRQLQERLRYRNIPAPQAIRQLASLFNYLDFIMNLLVSVLLNGLSLFHVHVLYSLDQWRKKNADRIMEWLEVIGEIEALNSFANFSFNNQSFIFPELSPDREWIALGIGHPLIKEEKRITNDIEFREERFVVLTGSNMSGKSTFLRTLGVNLVLARAGAPVCATKFRLFPFSLYVSMRITDSLQDSESLFYAELKRLQEIIRHLEKDSDTFVILDEILKGTNSNDKHTGTVGLIRKLAAHNTFGIVATHDLTVADMSREYPGYMSNRCFESIIIDDELIFDYRIKPGICSKLNASFLMKKMGIID